MPYDIPVLEKQPTESLLYDMDFLGRMVTGTTISSIVSFTASPSGLSVSPATFGDTRVQVRIGQGTSGVKYKLTAIVTDSAGNTLEGEGYLFVRDA